MKKLLLMGICFALLLAQLAAQTTRNVKGTVTDDKGLPLSGVTVSPQSTDKKVIASTVTDASGKFSIRIDEKTTHLTFSYVGMESQTIAVKGLSSVAVKLSPTAANLSDVVVVGYGTQKKANLTGSVSTLKMDEVLGDRPVSSTGALLQGAIPGLQVTIGSGQPGAGASFNVRGGTDFGTGATSSINTGGPFILVDNVPYNGPLNMLDPNDIESVTVLKDAGSAAIYGARSAFGVVLITTKKGNKNQRIQFNYSNNLVFSTPQNLPVKASPADQVKAWMDGGMTPAYNGNQNFLTWMQLLADYQKNPKGYPGGYTVNNGVYYQLAPTDAIRELLGNSAFQQMHNFSVSGGSDKTTYRISLGTTNEKGILVPVANQDKYSRYTIKSIVSSDVTSWLNMQLDAGYYHSVTTTPFYSNAFGDATNTPSVLPLDSIPTVPGIIATSKNEILATAPVTNRYNDIRATGRVIAKPVKGLTITGEYTVDHLNNLVTTYDKKASGFLNPYGYTASTIGSDKFTKSPSFTDYDAINIFGTYVKALGNHNFTLTAGYNQEQSHYEILSETSTGMINGNLPSISGTTGLIPIVGSDNYLEYATRGVFGRLNYEFGNKYLFQVNGRYDGSSKFPDGHRWGFFPSFSAGWRMMEEGFMKFMKPVVNELKLRGSIGSVGNQNIGDYQFYGGMTSYIPNWLYNNAQVGTLNAPPLVSNSFTWETVESKDIGLDWGMFRNRFTGSFDWYQRDTKDILTTNPTPLPSVLGTGAPLQNAGSLTTKGFELQLSWKDKIGKVTYYIGANLYDYQTTVTNAINPNGVITNSTLYTGKKMGEIWGYLTDRFYNVNDFVAGSLNANLRNGVLIAGTSKQNGQAPSPGDIMYKDLDSNGVITAGAGTLADHGDLRVIGNSSLRFQYGIIGGVSYKNFDLSFVISGVGKQDIWLNNTLSFPNQWLTYGALYAHQTNYWTPTNLNAFYGRIYTDNVNSSNQSFNQVVQTRFLQNGAYTRVKNITLRYNFPAALLKKAAISRLQVFYSIENPFMFDHLPAGLYPDVATQGSTAGGGLGYPFMKKSSIGINVSF